MNTLMLTLTILLGGIAGIGYSQPNPPQNPQNNPDAVPIAGIEYLLLAGSLYGAYRLTSLRKTSRSKATLLLQTPPQALSLNPHNPTRQQALPTPNSQTPNS